MAQPLFQTEKTVSPEVEKEVREMMTYQPWTEKQVASGKEVVEAGIAFILAIVKNVPPGPDRTVAIREIRNSRMWANSGITNGGRY